MVRFSVFCALLSFALVAVEIDRDQLVCLQREYQCSGHVLEGYPDHKKTLVIKYVRKDRKVCGMCFDTFKLAPEGFAPDGQDVWNFLDDRVMRAILMQAPAPEYKMEEVFQIIHKLFLEKHKALRPFSDCEPLEKPHMEDIISPQPFNPWTFKLTSDALEARIPGTVSITAVDERVCFVRVPKRSPPLEASPGE